MLFSTLDTHWEKNPEDEGHPEPEEVLKIREENLKHPQPTLFVLDKLLSIFKSVGSNWEVTEQITEVTALCSFSFVLFYYL